MSLINLLAFVVLVLLVVVGLAALVVLCQVLLPQVVARTRATAERMPVRSFLVGLINFLFFGLIAAAFTSGGDGGGLIALIIATTLLCFVAVGLTASARLVGERLRPTDASLLRQLVAGIVTLTLAALVPVVGWLAVPLLAGLTGYGALIITLPWGRRRSRAPAPPPADPPPQL